MLTINSFNLDSQTMAVFQQEQISDVHQMVQMLEQYRFLSREKLIAMIATDISMSGDSVKATKVLDVKGVPALSSQFAVLEKRYDILIQEKNGSVTIYADALQDLRVEEIELALFECSYEWVYLTPWNFVQLWHQRGYCPLPELEPLILFKRLVIECIHLNATDIHFVVEHKDMVPQYKVKYRAARQLLDLDLFPMDKQMNENIAKQVVASKTSAHGLDLTSDSGVQTVVTDLFGDGSIDIRFTANAVIDGMHYVGRLQMKKTTSMTIEQLGFPMRVSQLLMLLAKKNSGLTLITGEQCTGKNTTAFAIANEMVKRTVKIVDFSSPVEVLMPFPQTDYQADENYLLHLTRLIKKQDTDIVFLNEIPSKSTAAAVKELVNASIHVLTTTHVDRIWHLPYKLFEFYGEDYKNIISQINAIINQKMFRVLCDRCSEEILTASVEDNRIRQFLTKYGVNKVRKPCGCPYCTDDKRPELRGYKPGVNKPFAEVLLFTQEVKSALLTCREPYEMEQVIRDKVQKDKAAMEFELAHGIADGILSVDVLDSIL